MPDNKNLQKAKKAKDDEFYTKIEDVEAVCAPKAPLFADKIICCPCNDGETSAFTQYFSRNFHVFKLKKLICIKYKKDGIGEAGIMEPGMLFPIWKPLNSDGSIFGEEALKFIKSADYIITNPPFSRWRQFYALLRENKKDFLLLGSLGCIAYKSVFPDIMQNNVWLDPAVKAGRDLYFSRPGDQPEAHVPVVWLSTLGAPKSSPIEGLKTRAENETAGIKYPKYDNYDAIDIPRTTRIPSDYSGVMGVPVSFLGSYCPDQFEIVGCAGGWNGQSPLVTKVYSKDQFQHTFSKNKFTVKKVRKLNDGTPILRLTAAPDNCTYYKVDGGFLLRGYVRILIKHKNPQNKI